MRVFEVREEILRFLRNVAISLPTFLVDLGLLYLLVHEAHVEYLAATVASFLASHVLSYFLARWFVFSGTRRGVNVGLVYFMVIASLAAFVLTLLMWLFVTVFHLEIMFSRIASASITGVGGYLLNLIFNFRVAGIARPPGDNDNRLEGPMS